MFVKYRALEVERLLKIILLLMRKKRSLLTSQDRLARQYRLARSLPHQWLLPLLERSAVRVLLKMKMMRLSTVKVCMWPLLTPLTPSKSSRLLRYLLIFSLNILCYIALGRSERSRWRGGSWYLWGECAFDFHSLSAEGGHLWVPDSLRCPSYRRCQASSQE